MYLFNGMTIWRFDNLVYFAFPFVLFIKELLLAHWFLLILKFFESWLLRNVIEWIFIDAIQRDILIAERRAFPIHDFWHREIILSLFFIILPSKPFFHFSLSLFLSLNSFLFLYLFFVLLFKLFLLHLIQLLLPSELLHSQLLLFLLFFSYVVLSLLFFFQQHLILGFQILLSC